MNQFIMAVDPGKSGGIAVKHGNSPVYAYNMPDTGGDIVELFYQTRNAIILDGGTATAIVEEVSGFVGGTGQPGSAMFKFGYGYGHLIGVLQAQGWRVELVKPQKWIKAMSLGSRNTYASKTLWKNHLKAKAQQLFPHIKVTLSTADALLLLEYRLRHG